MTGEPLPGQSGQNEGTVPPPGPKLDAVTPVLPWSMGRPAEQPQQPSTQVEVGGAVPGGVSKDDAVGAKDLFGGGIKAPEPLRPAPPAPGTPATTEEFHAMTGLVAGEQPLGVAVTQGAVDQFRKNVEDAGEARGAATEPVKAAPPENLGMAISSEVVERSNKELYDSLISMNQELAGGLVPLVDTEGGKLLVYGGFGMHSKDGMVKIDDVVASEIKRLRSDRMANPGPIELEDLEHKLGKKGYRRIDADEDQAWIKGVEDAIGAVLAEANANAVERITNAKNALEIFRQKLGGEGLKVAEAPSTSTLGYRDAPPIEPSR